MICDPFEYAEVAMYRFWLEIHLYWSVPIVKYFSLIPSGIRGTEQGAYGQSLLRNITFPL